MRFRDRTHGRAGAARGGRVPGARAGSRISTRCRGESRAGGSRRRVHLSRRGRSRRQARVPADARRAVGAGALRRAEGRVPARGDGGRRAGRAAAARRVHRNRREDRRRPARAARTMPTALADGALPSVERSRAARDAGGARVRRRPRALQRSRDRPIDCLRCTTPPSRVPRSARRMPGPLLQVTDLTKEYPTPRGAAARAVGRVVRAWRRATRRRSWGRRAAARARCSTSSARSSRRRPAPSRSTAAIPFQLDAAELAAFRNKEIGFVFQDHCLLPQCTVLENVLVRRSSRRRIATMSQRARDARRAGRPRRPHRSPAGGAVGRRAAARRDRARADPQPRLLLCDEPTGNLDRAVRRKRRLAAARPAPAAERPSSSSSRTAPRWRRGSRFASIWWTTRLRRQ